jgi:hypothetical protein
MEYKCLACISEHIAAKNDLEAGVLHNGSKPEVQDIAYADTLAPQWVSQIVQGNMVMSCVAVPSCIRHLNVQKESPIQRATRSGLMLGGQAPQ